MNNKREQVTRTAGKRVLQAEGTASKNLGDELEVWMEQRGQCVSEFGLATKGEMVKARLPRSTGAGGQSNGKLLMNFMQGSSIFFFTF